MSEPRSKIAYEPKLQLWDAQLEGLRRMAGKEYFYLAMAMRTGKSPTVLADFGQLERDGRAADLCVISRLGVVRTWLKAASDHLSDQLQSRLKVHVWKSGASPKGQKERGEFLNQEGPRMLLINVEALSLAGDARTFVQYFLNQRRGKTYVVVDEGTIIKNNSKRTKFINKYVRPLSRFRRVLSGLPTPRSPLDLYYQYEFLDWSILGHVSYYSFRNRYAIMSRENFGGRVVDVVVGMRKGAEEELRKLTEPHSYRVQFKPKVPSTWSQREIRLTPQQVQAYEDLKRFSTTKLAGEHHVTASVVIAQMMRMHQVLCGWVRDEQGNLHALPETRTDALIEELEDVEDGGKAVVWFSYRENLERAHKAVAKRFGKDSVARFYGGNESSREADEQRFKQDDRCMIMLATPGTGGMGRTWDVADKVIYFSNTDNLEHRDQSEQRTLTVEKDRGVEYVDFVAPNTVEVKILQSIRKKINMSSAINGDNYREWLI